MDQRPTFDQTYMDVVDVIARRSTCLRKKVGAVIVVDRRIISHGYNGVVSGEAHCCDTGKCLKDLAGREDYKPCVHAEQNAICVCAKRGLAVKGGTLYVNADICVTCAKLIVSCELARVVVRRDFKGTAEGIEFLRRHGIAVDLWPAGGEAGAAPDAGQPVETSAAGAGAGGSTAGDAPPRRAEPGTLTVRYTLSEGGKPPFKATPGSAGWDVCAIEAVTVHPGAGVTVDTGLAVEVPPGYVLDVRPRSGLAFKQDILAFPGTIDSDYRGVVRVRLWNLGTEPYRVRPGERVAQFVLLPAPPVRWEKTEVLSDTARGEGGFGSTGKS
ncbi:MAG: dUTP diphosphatase [Firmicutes bacterium]|nr:dUTP diphosphatase [Bacillota bacterium]